MQSKNIFYKFDEKPHFSVSIIQFISGCYDLHQMGLIN